MSTTTLITADQFESMSFDQPVELVRGEIVYMNQPGHAHGVVCANVSGVLWMWSRKNDEYVVSSNDTGVQTESNPDTVRGPDVCINSKKLLGESGVSNHRLKIAPEIAIEVKSPSNSWRELVAKTAEFLTSGVKEVWIVDPETRHVHVYQEDTEPTIYTDQEKITSENLSGFSCEISEFFHNLPKPT